jgi:hypothetical protein
VQCIRAERDRHNGAVGEESHECWRQDDEDTRLVLLKGVAGRVVIALLFALLSVVFRLVACIDPEFGDAGRMW